MAEFDEVKATFWDDTHDGGLLSQPPLTDGMVAAAERELGLKLPSALLELLRIRNGGVVSENWSAHPTSAPTSWAPDHIPFDELMGIGLGEDSVSLLDSPYLVHEWGLPSPVVLLSGDGHHWVALDYRRCGTTGEPSVTWLDTDFGTELHLAPDFRSFVSGLVRGDDFDEGDDAS